MFSQPDNHDYYVFYFNSFAQPLIISFINSLTISDITTNKSHIHLNFEKILSFEECNCSI